MCFVSSRPCNTSIKLYDVMKIPTYMYVNAGRVQVPVTLHMGNYPQYFTLYSGCFSQKAGIIDDVCINQAIVIM